MPKNNRLSVSREGKEKQHLVLSDQPRPRYGKCDCDGLAQERDPRGHREGPQEALLYTKILHHRLTPATGKEKATV